MSAAIARHIYSFISPKYMIHSILFQIEFRCLEGVLNLHKEIKEDEYLIPYAIVEIALLYIDEGRIVNAIAALEDAKYEKSLLIVMKIIFQFDH